VHVGAGTVQNLRLRPENFFLQRKYGGAVSQKSGQLVPIFGEVRPLHPLLQLRLRDRDDFRIHISHCRAEFLHDQLLDHADFAGIDRVGQILVKAHVRIAGQMLKAFQDMVAGLEGEFQIQGLLAQSAG